MKSGSKLELTELRHLEKSPSILKIIPMALTGIFVEVIRNMLLVMFNYLREIRMHLNSLNKYSLSLVTVKFLTSLGHCKM